MDFGSILHAAQKNEKSSGSGSAFYKTKFEPPKKENKSKTLSSNIQKFLAKKEEEERSKVEEAKRKRNELLAMRDTKATNKIKKMLKVIKSANKSVLEDAVDNVNTAVTVNGPDQPDEDDYGYVSQEASAFYSKMMDKYKTIPDEDKKFASSKKVVNFDLSSTKDRVKAAILRHQEEEALPHKRKRRTHNGSSDRPVSPDYPPEDSQENIKKEEKPKPRRPAPPPLDFNELLKIAEKKQFEPVIETKKPEKIEEPERLMTKKQKREQEELRAFREAKLRRDQEKEAKETKAAGNSSNRKQPPSVQPPRPKPTNPLQIRIPKLSDKVNGDAKKPNPVPVSSEKSKTSSNDKDRNRSSSSSSKDRPSRDDDTRRSEAKTDINKNLKPSTSKSNIPSKHTEKPTSKPSNSKSSLDVRSSSSSSSQNKSKDLIKSDSRTEKRSLPEKATSDNTRPKLSIPSSNKSNLNAVKPNQTPHKTSGNPSVQKTSSHPQSSKQVKPDASKDSAKSDPKSRPVSSGKVEERKPTVNDQKCKPMAPSAKGNTLTPRELMQRRLAAEAAKEKSMAEAKKNLKPPNPPAQAKPAGKQAGASGSNAVRQFPPADVKGVRQFPPADVKKARQFPPPDVKGSRQFPPRDMDRRKEKQPFKRKILDEDDSEYDSELDDFIDDGPEDKNDYSKYIKEIFGYDKSRYKDVDDDDRNMESNFSQVMREEYISKKIGIMEDLEDMKMEAMEKKKKTQTKRRRIDD